MADAWTEIDASGRYTLVRDGVRQVLAADLTAEQITAAQWEFFGPDLMRDWGNVPTPDGFLARLAQSARDFFGLSRS